MTSASLQLVRPSREVSRVLVTPAGHPAWVEAIRNNWYEGSRWSPNRSWIWFPVQDAKRDLDRYTRYELSKRARYLYKNSPFIRGLIERLVTLTAGIGLNPIFKSKSNPDGARKVQEKWNKIRRNVNLGYRASFFQYSRAIARVRFLDGEGFSIKTYDEETYENRIQGVEADRCTGNESLDSSSDYQAANSVDGIGLNRQGTPKSYKFRGVDTAYSAEDVVHHYTPNRPGQYRGETILAAAINTAQDVDDILALEKQCVKDASSKQDIIKRGNGELNPEMFRTMRYGEQSFPTTFNLPGDDGKTKDDYYRVRFGAQPVVLQPGDEYTPYKPDRPGSAWQGFMAFLANTICLSSNLPPSVLLPVDVGGTDVRRDLDIAQRVVEAWQLDTAWECEELVWYLLQDDSGDPRTSIPDLYISWQFPPKVNVDRAQAQQDRADVQSGLMSYDEYHGRYGDDGDAYEMVVIEEVKRRKQRIKDAGFESPAEFVQYLSMDPKTFLNGQQPMDEPPTPPAPQPKLLKQ